MGGDCSRGTTSRDSDRATGVGGGKKKASLGSEAPRKKKVKKRKKRRVAADPFADGAAGGRKMLCCMTGTMRGHSGLEFKYGASFDGVWAYRPEHLDTTHALKSQRGAYAHKRAAPYADGARARVRAIPFRPVATEYPRFTMTAFEKEPGTVVCQGTFLDDPALWGHNKTRHDKLVFTVSADGVGVSGKGASHYGDYELAGTLVRSSAGDNHAKLKLTKYKPPVPWHYRPCDVCGSEDPSATLLLCDGQGGAFAF